ncbi:HNH endonuclease signature motif containing protein [Terrisporobacter hibernicus]|uniref:HNH endonuclease n=1 Tax=Terrisporobacter hibernicus TaxID=2813371 RepID=A0AAX2ZGI8_9FIRM|nr:HNH endonuclease signature motif containing protein [Terrisporobacter hibernicus]UEL47555.1 HNH endonuclease [Terrisporobacter hibernicus]
MKNKFGNEYRKEQLRQKARKLRVSTRLNGGFKKGHSINALDIGSESIGKKGFVMVKIAEPNIWEYKHKMIWEKVNGKVPEGYCLLFADKDKSNVSLDNLLLVSKRERFIMNKYSLIHDNKDFTVTGLNIARLMLKISEVKKR